MNLFGKLRDFLIYPTHKRTLGIVIMLVLAAAVSLTVVLSQQQQTIRQRAAVSAEQLAKGYVLCGDGLKCENNIKVDTPDKEGFNKCLSNKNFSGADKINGKYLTRCNSDLYYEDINNSNICSLVPGSNPSETTCTPPQPPTPEDYDYAFCGSGLKCNGAIVDTTDCGEAGKAKCLSTGANTNFDRDQITGRSLACCKASEYKYIGKNCTLVADGEYSDPQCEKRIPPTLSIDPVSINAGGDLNFSFTGFDPGEQVTVMVVGGGSITVKAGSDSNGKSLMPGLTEPAGKYTLKATGGSSGQSATAEFEIIATPAPTARSYVPCDNRSSGLYCKATRVDVSCGGNDKKCLASGGTWWGADAVDGKKLVCCNGTNYDFVDSVCTLTRKDAVGYKSNLCTPPNPPENDPSAILIIDPAPITTEGSLNYSFSGFQTNETVEIWVTNNTGPTGHTLEKIADASGNGADTISNLTESAGEYTLNAKGKSSERSAKTNFTISPTISSSAHVLPKLNTTTPVPASKLALPPTSIPATDRAHDLSAFNSSPTITPFVGPCRFKTKGDANCDDKITIVDFNVWKEEFTEVKTTRTADFNRDKKITIIDFNLWKGGFTDDSLQH